MPRLRHDQIENHLAGEDHPFAQRPEPKLGHNRIGPWYKGAQSLRSHPFTAIEGKSWPHRLPEGEVSQICSALSNSLAHALSIGSLHGVKTILRKNLASILHGTTRQDLVQRAVHQLFPKAEGLSVSWLYMLSGADCVPPSEGASELDMNSVQKRFLTGDSSAFAKNVPTACVFPLNRREPSTLLAFVGPADSVSRMALAQVGWNRFALAPDHHEERRNLGHLNLAVPYVPLTRKKEERLRARLLLEERQAMYERLFGM